MGRRILHVDFNSFYASVECLHHPELRELPVAVAGDPKNRHGIILAKNERAKKCGVKTGEAIWISREKCPDLVTVPPHFEDYIRFSRLGRELYGEYSSRVESFGLDENWVEVTGRTRDFQDAAELAEVIRRRVKEELGITVSIGAADNKIFAKLGSDYKKPDAVTVITPENYQRIVWPLPVYELLYVGPATTRKLEKFGILTIGDIARAEPCVMQSILGKNGLTLHCFANGQDRSPVLFSDERVPVKSIGNGVTTPRDLTCDDDVKLTLMMLCESVAERLRDQGFRARTVQLSIRDVGLYSFVRQKKLAYPSNLTGELLAAGMELFRAHYTWQTPVRSLSVTACDLALTTEPQQLSLFGDEQKRLRREQAEYAVDGLRQRFGHHAVLRGRMLTDERIGSMDPKAEHVIYPGGHKT